MLIRALPVLNMLYIDFYNIYVCVLFLVSPISTTPRTVTTIPTHIQMTPSPGWQNGSLPFTRALIADCKNTILV